MVKGRNGIIGIIILWAMILLSLILIGLSQRASYETKMVAYTWDRSQAFYLAWCGIEEVMRILREDDLSVDSENDLWAKLVRDGKLKGETKEGKWEVDILYDEERFIDVNRAGPVILKRIFGGYPSYYQALLDWLDPDDVPRPLGAESNDPFYVQQGYCVRNGFMKNLYELYMIKGGWQVLNPPSPNAGFQDKPFPTNRIIKHAYAAHDPSENPPEPPGGGKLFPGPGLPFPGPRGPMPGPPEKAPQGPPFEIINPSPLGNGLTVYSDGRTNINTAWTAVLKALGFLDETIRRIIWYRMDGLVFRQATGDYIIRQLLQSGWLKSGEPNYKQIVINIRRVAKTNKLKVNSSYFRVRVKAKTKKGTPYIAMAVIKRNNIAGNIKFEIVSWWDTGWL